MEILDRDYIEYEESLEHHGVNGQKWGVSHGPPYPLDKNAARQARKKEKAEKRKQRERVKRLKKARKVKAKNQAAKKKAAEKEAKEKEKIQKKKDKLSKSGTPGKVFRNRDLFTKDDIKDVLERFEWEQKLDNYSQVRLSNAANKAGSLARLFENSVGVYNTVAGVYNAWFPDDTQLPQIKVGKGDGGGGGGGGGGKKGGGGGGSKGGSGNSSSKPSDSQADAIRAVSEALQAAKKEEEKEKKGNKK